jgi:hypothetical protein
MNGILTSRLAAVRRKFVAVQIGSGIALALLLASLVLAMVMLIDWWVELPVIARAVGLGVLLAVLAWVVVRYMVWPVVFAPSDDEVALWCESQVPDARSRLISAVQLARTDLSHYGASPSMVQSLLRETDALVEPLDLTGAVRSDGLAKLVSLAALVLVSGGLAFAWGGQSSVDLLLRALLVPGIEVPRKTRVELLVASPMVIARGDAVTISARASGIIPDSGELVIVYASGAQATLPLVPTEQDRTVFSITIENVQQSFAYRAQLNDGRSREASVEAAIRPAVQSIEVWQIYPAYTGLGRQKRPAGDLSLLQGSRLEVNVQANKPARMVSPSDPVRNRLRLHGANLDVPLVVDAADRSRLSAGAGSTPPGFAVPVGTIGLSVHLVDDLGLTTRDPPVYRVELVPDRAPKLAVTSPSRKEELLTRLGSTLVGFDCSDDFGVERLKLRYEIKSVPGRTGGGDGLLAEYFDNEDLSGKPKRSRVEPSLDLDWRDGAPDGIRRDNFSGRLSGYVIPPTDGEYAFFVQVDDSVRLWVDERLLIDGWNDRNEYLSPTIKLTGGQPVPIRIEFREKGGEAMLRVHWQQAQRPRQVIPTELLFSSREKLGQSSIAGTGSIDLDLGGVQRSIRGFYEWKLPSLGAAIAEGMVIDWWLEATDNNNVTGPGKAESEKYSIRIGTEEEVRANLLNRLGDYAGQMEDLSDSQRELSDRLGKRILERPVQPGQTGP